MCVNYTPATRKQLQEVFDAPVQPHLEWPAETYPDYAAPIIRATDNGKRETLVANFGMIPKVHLPASAKHFSTMNARSETVSTLRSYAQAWKNGQFCLVPCEDFFEPNWETGKHVRWRIGMADHAPFAIAGLWRMWQEEGGAVSHSFTQLTVNADDHPLMKHFHKSGSEKRSLVIVPQEDYDSWLTCRDPEEARSFMRLFPAEKMGSAPAPKQKRATMTNAQENGSLL